MKTIRICSTIALLVSSSLSTAEVPTYDVRKQQGDDVTLVGIECHHRNKTLEIGLFFPTNPPTKRMDFWNISDLVKFNPSTYFLEKIEAVERKCNIGSNHYKIRFEGIPGANNAMWMCGAGTGVHVRIWKDGAMLCDEDMYRCNRDDYISNISFQDGVATPEVQRFNLN